MWLGVPNWLLFDPASSRSTARATNVRHGGPTRRFLGLLRRKRRNDSGTIGITHWSFLITGRSQLAGMFPSREFTDPTPPVKA